METNRINKACAAYPCHDKDKLEDCTFCYCPLYPCENEEKGRWKEGIIHPLDEKREKFKIRIWDCSNCTWPHNKKRVDNLFKFLTLHWVG